MSAASFLRVRRTAAATAREASAEAKALTPSISAAIWLCYLGFLFLPLLWRAPAVHWLAPTLLSLPVFLYFYLRPRLLRQGGQLWEILGMVVLAYALAPFNECANTYLLFACARLPFVVMAAGPLAITVAILLALHTAQSLALDLPAALPATTVILAFAASGGTFLHLRRYRAERALQQSHDEIRRLAIRAERERIGRDLHDLLGHTLSLISVKLELADKLLTRDGTAARAELQDAQRVTREALAQVRAAVTGIRDGSLSAELAASRALLEASGIRLHCAISGLALEHVPPPAGSPSPHAPAAAPPMPLPAAAEQALAMVLREAITNIHRHSGARLAQIELSRHGDDLALQIRDDGCGGVRRLGNGLRGLHERVAALGGSCTLQSPPGLGTSVSIRVPLAAVAPV